MLRGGEQNIETRFVNEDGRAARCRREWFVAMPRFLGSVLTHQSGDHLSSLGGRSFRSLRDTHPGRLGNPALVSSSISAFGRFSQKTDIVHDRHQVASRAQPSLGRTPRRAEMPTLSRFAPRNRDDPPHLPARREATVEQRSPPSSGHGKIARPDIEAVQAVDRGDVVEIGEPRWRFDHRPSTRSSRRE